MTQDMPEDTGRVPLQCMDSQAPSMVLYQERAPFLCPHLKELVPSGRQFDEDDDLSNICTLVQSLIALKAELVPSGSPYQCTTVRHKLTGDTANIPVDIDPRVGQLRRDMDWRRVQTKVPLPDFDELGPPLLVSQPGPRNTTLQQWPLDGSPPLPDFDSLLPASIVPSLVAEGTNEDSGVAGLNRDNLPIRNSTGHQEVALHRNEELVQDVQEEVIERLVPVNHQTKIGQSSSWRRNNWKEHSQNDLEMDSGVYSEPSHRGPSLRT